MPPPTSSIPRTVARDASLLAEIALFERLAFGGCVESPFHVMTLSYIGDGSSPPCAVFRMGNYPESNNPRDGYVAYTAEVYTNKWVTNKWVTNKWVKALPLVVNPDNNCDCAANAPTPVESTAWGRVKALYAD